MGKSKTRTQEYAEATRQALLHSAADLFADCGYSATSIEDVARGARVTRGALYHHFASKRELFEAVVIDALVGVVDRIARVMGKQSDPWAQALAGLEAFLDTWTDPRVSQLCIRQASVALSWERMRELDQRYSMGLLRTVLQALMDHGDIEPQPLDLLVTVMTGILHSAALAISAADDAAQARADAGRLLRQLLEGLRPRPQ